MAGMIQAAWRLRLEGSIKSAIDEAQTAEDRCYPETETHDQAIAALARCRVNLIRALSQVDAMLDAIAVTA